MKKLSFVLLIMLTIFTFYRCNQQAEPDRLKELSEFPEIQMVKKSSFNSFYNDLITFSDGLTAEQRKLLDNYADGIQANAKTNTVSPTCECTSGQGKCSAEGTFNSCCICCPAGRGFACGVTFGIASCRCEDAPPPAKKGSNQEVDDTPVQIKALAINEMFNFAAQNGIDVSDIKKSLKELVQSAN